MIVPTLCVGMKPETLRVSSRAGRGASVEAFPRRAWERSATTKKAADSSGFEDNFSREEPMKSVEGNRVVV
jgi:hypothetical protein